ncbi:MAG TPA: alpha/beta fold hydrolase, partial [Thiomonas arsenitoxydans]|nr:alpha/beta fold hydrolase [Thiomonas arsenitoxydans]
AGPRALVVMHGWGGNAANFLPVARHLQQAGYSLLLLDARCHGESDDDSFASLPRFAEDIEAGMAWLVGIAGIERDALAVIGHSVGGGAALLVASRRREIRGVISLSAFAHPAAMMRRWLDAKHIPYWPLGAYVLRYVQRVIGYRFDDIAPIHTIARVRCPVLLVHGRDDAMVPLAEARAIRAAAGHADVDLLELVGNHEEFGDVDGHVPKLLGFLEQAFARRP